MSRHLKLGSSRSLPRFVAVCGLAGVTDQELRRRTGADFDCFLIDDHAGALRDEIEFLISKPYLEPLRIYRLLRLRRQKRRDRRCRPLAETGEAEPAAFPVPTVAPGNLSNYPGRTFIGVVRRWAGGVVESVDSVAYYVESRAPGWWCVRRRRAISDRSRPRSTLSCAHPSETMTSLNSRGSANLVASCPLEPLTNRRARAGRQTRDRRRAVYGHDVRRCTDRVENSANDDRPTRSRAQ